ncbi:MAG: RDD family protein [Cyanobacteria bacterium SID2]|nr:RDD family protein [Cyanobacteria bacterium SID2]
MDNDPTYLRIPRVPLWRRGCAFGIDSAIAWFLCAMLGGTNGFAQFVAFALAWLSMRVVVTASNYGQSPGRWALDMRVIENRYNRTPGLVELLKREAISGLCAFWALTGFFTLASGIFSLDSRNAFYLLLFLPLAVDVGIAWFDPLDPSAFHDRIAQTLVVATRRGYSLDLKVKKWVALIRQNMKQ